MYKVELTSSKAEICDLSNVQLICSYIFVKKTFNHLYKKKLKKLTAEEKKAIIYDLTLYENIKQKRYSLRCTTPQKWLENWKVFNGITSEMAKRELSIKNLEFN